MQNKYLLNTVRFAKRVIRFCAGRDHLVSRSVKLKSVLLGNDGAAWSVIPNLLHHKSVVYSVGIGTDISFDLGLMQLVGADIHAFDPTPRSLKWLASQELPSNFIVHEYGLGGNDGVLHMVAPESLSNVSYCPLEIAADRVASRIEVPIQSLPTITARLEHGVIDLLKMDIEGAEYEVIASLAKNSIQIDQLLIEFHHRWPAIGVQATLDAVESLKSQGYLVFYVSPNGEEFGFVHERALQ